VLRNTVFSLRFGPGFQPACRGTGRWGNYGNRPCFKCNSTGKLTFKSSPETRQANRVATAERKASKVDAFAAEYPEIIAWFERSGIKSQKPFPFAVSLQESLIKYGSLTDNQIAAARRCIAKYEAAVAERAKQREVSSAIVDASKIETAFATARERAKRRVLWACGPILSSFVPRVWI
jgi:hypothetical protein